MTPRVVLVSLLLGLLVPGTLANSVGAGSQWLSDNPDVEELMGLVDMNHPAAVKNQQYIDTTLTPEIVVVIPGRVYQAAAYMIGYPIVVVLDDDTLLAIDVPENTEIFDEVLELFRAIPAIGNKPFRAIAVTMFHGDHLWTICSILKNINVGLVDIYMHERTVIEERLMNAYNAMRFPRLVKQLGLFLPDNVFLHHITVKKFVIEYELCPEIPRNIHKLRFGGDVDEILINIGNTEIIFIPTPGYSPDHTSIFIPSLNLLHTGDSYYHSFLNGYPLRGEVPRDIKSWATVIGDGAKKSGVTTVTGTHGKPMHGSDIKNLQNIADTLHYVFDQTLRYMMKGWSRDNIGRYVRLPAAQRARPYNEEFYGTVETTSKAVYTQLVGWFDGDVEDLTPVLPEFRRQQYNEIIGVEHTLVVAAKAYDDDNFSWCLELASNVFKEDKSNRRAKELRTLANIRLGEQQMSINVRYYYLSSVLEDWDLLPLGLDINTLGSIGNLDMDGVFIYLTSHVDAEKLETEGGVNGLEKTFFIDLDTGTFRMDFRNGILEIVWVDAVPTGALALHTTEAQFRDFLQTQNLQGTASGGTLQDIKDNFEYIDFTDQVE